MEDDFGLSLKKIVYEIVEGELYRYKERKNKKKERNETKRKKEQKGRKTNRKYISKKERKQILGLG
jgi:hypothetical protein